MLSRAGELQSELYNRLRSQINSPWLDKEYGSAKYSQRARRTLRNGKQNTAYLAVTSFIAPRGRFVWLTGIMSHHTHARTRCKQRKKHVQWRSSLQFIERYLFVLVNLLTSGLHLLCAPSSTSSNVSLQPHFLQSLKQQCKIQMWTRAGQWASERTLQTLILTHFRWKWSFLRHTLNSLCVWMTISIDTVAVTHYFICKTQLLFYVTSSIFWHLLSRGVNTDEFRFKCSRLPLAGYHEHEAASICHPMFSNAL